MRRFSFSVFFIGIGIGMIFSYFFVLRTKPKFDPSIIIETIPDEIIIQRAKEMGLVDLGLGIDKESMHEPTGK